MYLIVSLISGVLKSFQERVEKWKECVYWRKSWDGRVSREINHCLFDVFVSDVFSCRLVVLFLVEYTQLLPYTSTDRVMCIITTFDSIERVFEYPQKSSHALPGIVNHLSISICNSWPQFLQLLLSRFLFLLDFLKNLRHRSLDLMIQNVG